MKSIATGAILALALTLAVMPAARADFGVGVEFSDEEVRIISAWYRDNASHADRRGQGRKSKGLPPGIARNLARGKPLPPGIAKQHLPEGLLSVLPPPRKGYERIVVDGRVLLVEIATQVIHDVLSDAILK
jgi:Ni/Co efflux regulator RcnB